MNEGDDFAALDSAGLNLHAVLALDALPGDMTAQLRERFDREQRYRQLILIGHGGRALWAAVKASGIRSANPIDEFSIRTVEQWFGARFPERHLHIIYPGPTPVGLQALGQIAGWHHASPFRVGINQTWGSWYAYRVALLADTELAPTRADAGASPCDACSGKPCIAACPAGALDGGDFSLAKCVGYRKQESSLCATSCMARIACPIGSAHRYEDAQIHHSYSISLREILRYA